MANQNKKYRKYDHSKVIGEHVKNLSKQVSDLDDTENKEWSKYFNGVVMGIAYLDAMLDPFKDDNFNEVFTEGQNFGNSKSQQIKFVHNSLTKYFNLMYRRKLFYASHTEEIIGGKDDE